MRDPDKERDDQDDEVDDVAGVEEWIADALPEPDETP